MVALLAPKMAVQMVDLSAESSAAYLVVNSAARTAAKWVASLDSQ